MDLAALAASLVEHARSGGQTRARSRCACELARRRCVVARRRGLARTAAAQSDRQRDQVHARRAARSSSACMTGRSAARLVVSDTGIGMTPDVVAPSSSASTAPIRRARPLGRRRPWAEPGEVDRRSPSRHRQRRVCTRKKARPSGWRYRPSHFLTDPDAQLIPPFTSSLSRFTSPSIDIRFRVRIRVPSPQSRTRIPIPNPGHGGSSCGQ